MSTKVYNDSEIIQHIQAGNESPVLMFLYKFYYPKVRKNIISKGGRDADAKDVFQDSILVLFQAIIENKYGLSLNIGAFISTVSVRIWIDKIRKDKKMTFDNEIIDVNYSNETSSMLLNKEKEQIVNDIMSSIGEKCKELLVNTIYHKFSMKEIAVMLGFSSEESAKTQHYKCKQKLVSKFKNNLAIKKILQDG